MLHFYRDEIAKFPDETPIYKNFDQCYKKVEKNVQFSRMSIWLFLTRNCG